MLLFTRLYWLYWYNHQMPQEPMKHVGPAQKAQKRFTKSQTPSSTRPLSQYWILLQVDYCAFRVPIKLWYFLSSCGGTTGSAVSWEHWDTGLIPWPSGLRIWHCCSRGLDCKHSLDLICRATKKKKKSMLFTSWGKKLELCWVFLHLFYTLD